MTLILNIHLIDMSEWLAVIKSQTVLCYQKLPCCLYIHIKSLIQYLQMKTDTSQELCLAL